jgi:hypothetical protein
MLLLLPLVGEVHPAAELLRVDHDALDAGRHLERVVLHVLAGAAEDRVQQLLFRASARSWTWARPCRRGCRRGRRACRPDDAALVEVAQRLLGDVGDVAGELLAAQLRLADLDVELVDVDRREDVVLDERSLITIASSKL